MPAVKIKENEPFDVALRRFKRSCEKAGLLKQEGNRLKWVDPETGEEFKFYRKEWKDDKLDMIMNNYHLKSTPTIPEEKTEDVE